MIAYESVGGGPWRMVESRCFSLAPGKALFDDATLAAFSEAYDSQVKARRGRRKAAMARRAKRRGTIIGLAVAGLAIAAVMLATNGGTTWI